MSISTEKNDWKKLEKNNVTIALNIFYAKKEKIHPVYLSKHNSNREKQVIKDFKRRKTQTVKDPGYAS